MAEPARKPAPQPDATLATPAAAPATLRPRALREAAQGESGGAPSEVHRLQDRVAQAFTDPGARSLERVLMKLIILASACLFLRVAIVDGGGLIASLLH